MSLMAGEGASIVGRASASGPEILDNYLGEVRDTAVLTIEEQDELCESMIEAEQILRATLCRIPETARQVVEFREDI